MLRRYKIPFDVIWLLAIMWSLFIVDFLLSISLNFLGLSPRRLLSLPNIFTFPLVHSGLWHIVSNSLPFVILGSIIQLYGRTIYWLATFIILLVGGIGTWLFSSAGIVVGASGLIFGYWSFLLSSAYFRKSLKTFVIAFVVFIFYGSLLFGLFDLRSHISWAGHFWGLIGGVAAAYWSVKNIRNAADSKI